MKFIYQNIIISQLIFQYDWNILFQCDQNVQELCYILENEDLEFFVQRFLIMYCGINEIHKLKIMRRIYLRV